MRPSWHKSVDRAGNGVKFGQFATGQGRKERFVNYFLQNRTLGIALVTSIVFHGALLLLHFTAPDSFRLQPADPGLEVILVNAKHDKKPLKADALAQANLDGGGNTDKGRAKSPLPDMRKSVDGDSTTVAQQRIAELEELQAQMLTQLKKDNTFRLATKLDRPNPNASSSTNGADLLDNARQLARSVAEISQSIEDQNKRPRKTFITPSTQAVGYAVYYKAFQKRVEDIGTLNFPQRGGNKLYGELIVYIPIFQDGSIYEKEGGVRIERSSGNPDLDKAAMRIVRRAAPFGKFPPNMLSGDRDDLWVIITRFKFTRDDTLQTILQGGAE
jgi:protein TonB